MEGFVVYRRQGDSGHFLQLGGSLLKGNTFVDKSVMRNTTYWYQVAVLNKDGTLSKFSSAKSGRVTVSILDDLDEIR
jgi:hypothetical protein